MKEILKNIDYALFQLINQQMNVSALDSFFLMIRNPDNLRWFYFFLALVFLFRFRLKGLWLVLSLAATMGLSDLISSHFFKPYFHRLRPCTDEIWKGKIIDLVGGSHGYSFTSSHAANNMSVCLFLALLFLPHFKRWTYLFLIVPLFVGYAQIYVGLHYPIDVVCGWATGAASALLMYFLYKKYLPKSQQIQSA